MSVAYKDYANDKPEDSARLSSGEITAWFHANIASEPAGLAAGGISGLNSFPGRLYRILSNPELSDVIRWMDHGRAWKVLQPKVFAAEVLPKYSATSKYPNFVRQVNAWGFRRILTGRDKNCYFHEMFLRSRPHLVGRMKKPKGKAEPTTEFPKFYYMPYLPQEGSEAGDTPSSPMYTSESCSGSTGMGGWSSDDESNRFSPYIMPAFAPAAIAKQAAAAQGKVQSTMATNLGQQFQAQQPQLQQQQQQQQQRMKYLSGQAGQNGQFSGTASLPVIVGMPLHQQQQNVQMQMLLQGNAPKLSSVGASESNSEPLASIAAAALPMGGIAVTQNVAERSTRAGMLQTVPDPTGQIVAGDHDSLLGPGGCGADSLAKKVNELKDDLVIDNLLRQAEAETSNANMAVVEISAAGARAGAEMTGRRRSSVCTQESGASFERAFGRDEDVLAVLGEVARQRDQEEALATTAAGQQVQQSLHQMAGAGARMTVNARATVLCVGKMPPSQQADNRQQQQPQIDVNLQVGMPAEWFTQLESSLRPLYEWSQTLDVETHIRLEMYLPVAFPIMSLLLGHSALGFTICFTICVAHTIGVLVTDFGPRTAAYCWQSWIGPNGHRIMDTCVFGGLTLMMFVMPDEFGPYATESGIFLFFAMLEFLLVASHAQLYIGESKQTKKRRDARQKATARAISISADLGEHKDKDNDLKTD